MKGRRIFFPIVLVVLCSSIIVAQKVTNGTGGGNWSSGSTWQGGSVPSPSDDVTIQATDSIYFDVQVTLTGHVKNLSGKAASFDSSKVVFGNGAVYEHAANSGSIPKATWNVGSTVLFTGVTGNMPNNTAQNFYNITWNCPDQSTGLNLGMATSVIGGDVRVINSNSVALRLTAGNITVPSGRKLITINGNIYVDSAVAFFTATGSGSPDDTFSVVVKGNIYSKGRFELANGSGASVNWFVEGNISALEGIFSTNSTATKPDSLFFSGTQRQMYVRGGDVTSSNIRYSVLNGSIVDFDTSNTGTSSNASFTLKPGATFISGHTNGVNGNIRVPVDRITLSEEGNYGFSGTVAQVTGTLLPTTVHNLTIDNATGVVLSQATTINGVLTLKAGEFDNTIPFTLGPSGSISYEGGSLKHPMSVRTMDDLGTPKQFFVEQNYPNPFNPATTIHFGIPQQSSVTVKVYNLIGQEIVTLYNGELKAGVHEVKFNASHLTSGMYLYRVQAGNYVDVKRMMLIK